MNGFSQAQRLALSGFLLLFVLFGVVYAVGAHNSDLAREAVLHMGKRVDGRVVLKNAFAGMNNETEYSVTVAYSVNGIAVKHDFDVSKDRYSTADIGESVSLAYMPQDPSKVQLADAVWAQSNVAEVQVGVGIVVIGLAVLSCLWFYWLRF